MPVKRLLIAALMAGRLFGAIGFDSSASVTGNSAPGYTWNHTTVAATTGVLILIMSQPPSTNLVSGVAVDGVPASLVKYCPSAGSYQTIYAYYLGGVSSGTHAITVDWTANFWFTEEVSMAYSGAALSVAGGAAPICGTVASSGNPTTQTITTTGAGSWVIGAMQNYIGVSFGAGAGTVLRKQSGFGLAGADNGAALPSGSSHSIALTEGAADTVSTLILELPAYSPPRGVGSARIL